MGVGEAEIGGGRGEWGANAPRVHVMVKCVKQNDTSSHAHAPFNGWNNSNHPQHMQPQKKKHKMTQNANKWIY